MGLELADGADYGGGGGAVDDALAVAGKMECVGHSPQGWLRRCRRFRLKFSWHSPAENTAMPLVARAMSHPRALRAPEAISLTTGMLTAPWASSDASLTSSRRRFTSLEYDTTPPSMAAELPGSAVIVWAMLPPVQLSAVPTVRWRSTSMSSRHRAGVMSPRHIRLLEAASRASSSARRSISFSEIRHRCGVRRYAA